MELCYLLSVSISVTQSVVVGGSTYEFTFRSFFRLKMRQITIFFANALPKVICRKIAIQMIGVTLFSRESSRIEC